MADLVDGGRCWLHYGDSVTTRLRAPITAAEAATSLLGVLQGLSLDAPTAVELRRSREAKEALAPAALLSDGADFFAVAIVSPRPPDAAVLLGSAKELESQRRLAAANELYSSILSAVGDRDRLFAPTAFLSLAANALAVGFRERALSLLRRAVDAHPKDGALMKALADALLASSDHVGAGRCYEIALGALRAAAAARPTQGSRASLAAAAAAHRASEHDLLVGQATALYGRGKREEGAALVMRVLSETDEKHPAALLQYARISLDMRKVSDALPALLRLLAAQPKRRELKELLAACARLDRDGSLLAAQLQASGDALAAALSFLALAVRDGGEPAGAAALLARSTALRPTCPSTALALCHAREACAQTGEALEALAAFSRAAEAPAQGADAAGRRPTRLGLLPRVLARLPPLPSARSSAACEWYASDRERNALLPLAASQPLLGGAAPAPQAYRAAELDALACLFVAAKLLFVGGACERSLAVVALTEPSVLASATPLHESSVRNEAAFFRCVAAIVRRHPVPRPPPALPPPLFVLGDSHVLPPAWRAATLRGAARTLVPILITGLKAYHLRPGSSFFTRAHLAQAAARLPAGSPVVSLFGEIDCREGLQMAVQKGAYDSVQQAAAAAAGWYVDALVELAAARSFEFFAHPVPPVLEASRAAVAAFNVELARAVGAAANPRLRALRFGDRLLSGPGGALAPEFCLDGTHLAPAYVAAVLQPALDSCTDLE